MIVERYDWELHQTVVLDEHNRRNALASRNYQSARADAAKTERDAARKDAEIMRAELKKLRAKKTRAAKKGSK